MMKKLLALLIAILLTPTPVFASDYDNYAVKLKEIGVFHGTNSGFELDREPKRVEAAIMFVRLLGAEQEALEKNYEHPFKDVPEWANAYIGYLYHEKLTNGTSATTFGSNDYMRANSYFTFILRALEYDDSAGDFIWNRSLEFAKNNQLISDSNYSELSSNTFYRDHVAKVSYLALQMPVKHEELTLAEHLVDLNAIDREKAITIGIIEDERFQPLTGLYEIINFGDINLSDGNTIYEFDDVNVRYGKNEGGEDRIYVSINRSSLPSPLNDFVYYNMLGVQYSGDETKTSAKNDILALVNKWPKYYNYDSLGEASNGRYGPDGTVDFMQIVRIYNQDKNLIGYCAIRLN